MQHLSLYLIRLILITFILFCPLKTYASFIEATIGTAVVNDATATYLNPAALTLLKNPQAIGLCSYAASKTQFNGQATQSATHFTQTGSSSSTNQYYLPSIYLGLPASKKITVGVAVISNLFNRDNEDPSILRYAQSGNQVQNIDFVSGIGFKINDTISLGVGAEFSYANFLLKPIAGFPSLTIPDATSRNQSTATGWGGNAGILIQATKSTLIGFNYRSSVTYPFSGTSIFEGPPRLVSRHYNFDFWTPARSVLSVNQFVTKKLGFIGTIQYIQWSIIKNVHLHNFTTLIGPRPGIVPAATANVHLNNSFIYTFGSYYRILPKWVVRVAGSYFQSPGNPDYQICNGNSVIIGGSTGYEINKNITLDGSYAHDFIQNQKIHVTGRNIINGVNKGSRDAVSLKLTFNVV